jgi:hypothetical protein
VVALLAAGGIVGLLAVLYFYVLPRNGGAAAAPAPTSSQAALQQPGPAGSSATGAHPLAKHIEITGVRLSEAKAQRIQVQLVVVNHSAADLPSLKAAFTITSGGRNFFEFPATIPALGPYEVREIGTTLKTDLKPYELPDWQLIRTQFRIDSDD